MNNSSSSKKANNTTKRMTTKEFLAFGEAHKWPYLELRKDRYLRPVRGDNECLHHGEQHWRELARRRRSLRRRFDLAARRVGLWMELEQRGQESDNEQVS